MKPLQILYSLLAIAAIVVFPHLGLIPNFGYTIPLLLVVWLVLKQNGEKFSDIGFRFKPLTLKAVLIGSGAAVAILSIMQGLVFPLLELFVELEEEDLGLYDIIRENKIQLLIMIVMGWLIGGFYEEIVFHGFIFTRLEKMIPGQYTTVLSFVIACLLFGAYHLQMGAAGAFNALVVGMVYQGLFLYFKRDLWASIICHGVYNTLVMTLIHLGYLLS
ncbi:MAG: type II CAAX endopeptidase family protein [Bacteroidota bacterium]